MIRHLQLALCIWLHYRVCHHYYFCVLNFVQRIRSSRRRVLTACKTQMDLGDEGPYQGLVEALKELCVSVDPARIPPSTKGRARQLKSILKSVYNRIKEFARRKFTGVAQLLYTEIAGHGGLSIFRRLDAACVANEKSEQKTSFGGVGYRRGGAEAARGGRGRGGVGQRGRGDARRNAADILCYNCYQRGHIRNNCPEAPRNAPAANDQ